MAADVDLPVRREKKKWLWIKEEKGNDRPRKVQAKDCWRRC